jgi:hypothetical protein
MQNLPATKNAAYVDCYRQGNGFSTFADEGSMPRLRFAKGDFFLGRDKEIVPGGTRYLALVRDTATRGMVRWEDKLPVEARCGLIRDNFLVPHRNALGHLDEALWPKGPDGLPADPWSMHFSVQLIPLAPPHSAVQWVGSSWGAKECLRKLCSGYRDESDQYTGQHPVVELATFNKQDPKFGIIKQPELRVVGWATEESVRSGHKAGGAKALPKGVSAATVAKAAAKAGVQPVKDDGADLANVWGGNSAA